MLTLGMAMERVRRDLGDTDVVNAVWSGEDLERHLRRAVREISLEVPREMKAVLQTTAGSRDVSVASLMGRVGILAVEWPVGEYPARYVRWSVWQETLTLLVDGAPTATENVNVLWHGVHSLEPDGSSVPGWAEELVVLGGVGYALEEASVRAVNDVNLGGSLVAREYARQAVRALGEFREGIQRRGIRGSVRVSRFYVPAAPLARQDADWGPA